MTMLRLMLACLGLGLSMAAAAADAPGTYEYAVFSVPLERPVCDHPPCRLPGMSEGFRKIVEDGWEILSINDDSRGASLLWEKRRLPRK